MKEIANLQGEVKAQERKAQMAEKARTQREKDLKTKEAQNITANCIKTNLEVKIKEQEELINILTQKLLGGEADNRNRDTNRQSNADLPIQQNHMTSRVVAMETQINNTRDTICQTR